jgi:hypothetical protein
MILEPLREFAAGELTALARAKDLGRAVTGNRFWNS